MLRILQKLLSGGKGMESVNQRGYLNGNYRLFHSVDRRDMDFQSHCHDFHKVLLCLSGHVTYIMEGRTYRLAPWDLMIIPEHQIHRSIFEGTEAYERMVLWISDAYLRSFADSVLADLFRLPFDARGGLIRLEAGARREALEKLLALEKAQKSEAPGHTLLADTYLVQFLLCINGMIAGQAVPAEGAVSGDPRLDALLDHINRNLGEDLSIEALSRLCFFSPSYLMHAFKRYTGCTVHRYVRQKRLISARSAIESGEPILTAARQVGFSDYSVFLRAFREMFGCMPSDLRQKSESTD